MFPLYTLENCMACGVCAKVCPQDAISIDIEVKFDGRRFLRSFEIDYSKCDSCMKCVEKCRRGTIVRVKGEKPDRVYRLKDLMKLKRVLGIRSKRRSEFVDECLGCLMCYLTCPVNAVRYEDSDGIRSITIDGDVCEGCGMCVTNCPNYALEVRA